jgi:hypothetical protein
VTILMRASRLICCTRLSRSDPTVTIRFLSSHSRLTLPLKTFGSETLEVDPPILEAFIAEARVTF